MAQKEHYKGIFSTKLLIPICIALPLNVVILRDKDSGNCIAVTEDGECPYAKRRHHVSDKFECRKDTLMKIDTSTLIRQ